MNPQTEIKVSIVEDESRYRESLALIVDGTEGMRCISNYEDGDSALNGLPSDDADVVLLDINLPERSGIEILRSLRSEMATTQFVMITTYNDDDRIFRSLAAGASGYLLKRSSPAEILEAIVDVHEGGSPMSSTIARRVVQSFVAQPPADAPGEEDEVKLSPRENEILGLLAKGFLYKEIASELKISITTVRTHLRRIYEKLQVHTRTEAVVRYFKRS